MPTDEDDPILRMAKSREEEAKKDAEARAEIARKILESNGRRTGVRIATEEEIQKKRRESWQ
jgi:hypothetical protein